MDPYDVTINTWDKLSQAYQDQFMDMNLYDDTYDILCENLPYAANLIEVGCGPGNITRYLLGNRPDLQILGTDVSPQMVSAAIKNNPGAEFRVMDARELHLTNRLFDAVVCGFCIPYLAESDYSKFIYDCRDILNPGGMLYFSAIEGNYSDSGYEQSNDGQYTTYVYYYDEQHLLAELQGFRIIKIIRKNFEKGDGSPSVHIIIIAKKQEVLL
jgi:ubiquinone/menaquinone biosynthesis C-methylase UbiE